VRKRTAALYVLILLIVLLGLTNVARLRLADLASWVVNTAPTVIPSLREWQGASGTFTMVGTSRIVVDPSYTAQLQNTPQVFQSDLLAITRHKLPLVVSRSPVTGDFFLTVSNADHDLGSEGYRLKIADYVTISALTRTGVFYGTRTVLQILLQDPTQTQMPQGTARDYPKYAERGFMLDAGRKFFSITSLEDYVKLMAWYKMNDFQIHLNDNEIGGGDSPDWMHKYAAFRLNSTRFKGLAASDGSYTRQDIQALEAVAQSYAVTITPEIDAPAHDLALTQYRPDLASQQYSKEMLDLSNPATYTFLNSMWDEFLPWFTGPQVHIGADEYDKRDADKYRQFINTYAAYLESKGKTVRMWGSLSELQSSVKVDHNIIIDDWSNRWANPVDMVKQGFYIVNANDNLLYIVPKAGYYHDYLDTQLLYEQWEPYIFDLSNPALNLSPNDPHVLGGMFAEWNDKLGSVVSDTDVYDRVKPAMQTVGDKLWSGPTPDISYVQFEVIATILSAVPVPGTHFAA
jgi:hexosaminidase